MHTANATVTVTVDAAYYFHVVMCLRKSGETRVLCTDHIKMSGREGAKLFS